LIIFSIGILDPLDWSRRLQILFLPGAKLYPGADQRLDDSDRWRNLLLATSVALPLPKAKKRRHPRGG
jgi:hypothetical protein